MKHLCPEWDYMEIDDKDIEFSVCICKNLKGDNMPAKNNTGTGNTNGNNGGFKKAFNPTITAFFDAPKFGMDATPNTPDQNVERGTTASGKPYNKVIGSAFLSSPINAEAFENIQKHIQIGSTLLLRQGPNLNKNGGRTFFLEVRPPAANAGNSYSQGRNTGRNAGGENDI